MNRGERSSARWARVIDEQRVSGLSIAEFCRRRDVPPPSFYAWRRRLSTAGGAVSPARAAPAFVEVKVGPRDTPPSDAGGVVGDAALELISRRGLRVLVRRGFDPELLRQLLTALEAWA